MRGGRLCRARNSVVVPRWEELDGLVPYSVNPPEGREQAPDVGRRTQEIRGLEQLRQFGSGDQRFIFSSLVLRDCRLPLVPDPLPYSISLLGGWHVGEPLRYFPAVPKRQPNVIWGQSTRRLDAEVPGERANRLRLSRIFMKKVVRDAAKSTIFRC